jgi:two-component system, LytTR family, sensor kinase
MDALQQLSTANLIAQTYGFAIGTVLATLLLILVWRSGGTDRRPRFLFAACILIANASGLAKNLVLALDASRASALAWQIRSIGFIAAAMVPLSIMIIWRDNAVSKARRKIGDVLIIYAASSGLLIATGLVFGTFAHQASLPSSIAGFLQRQDSIGNLTIYNGLLLVVLGAIFLLPGTLDDLTNRVAVVLIIAGLALSSISAVLDAYVSLPTALAHIFRIARFQSIVLVVIGSLFYFSRFRAADLFAKQAVRLLLSAALAIFAAFLVFGPLASIAQATASPRAVSILCAAAITCGAMLLYARLRRWSDTLVERGIFGKRDTQLAVREFRDGLGLLQSKSAVLSAMQALAVEVLGMKSGEISIHNAEPRAGVSLSVPIPSQGDTLQLVVSLAGNRRTLLTAEIDSLREIALHAGRRLDDLDREEERMESIRLESRLSQQLAQAELRALRAQINPHFLFNSLNTIAALIASDPDKAETITVRLAGIFRYVLLHADRPFSSLDEEVSFLRTYLDIEQVRFGERLQVEFDVEASVVHAAVPSLILQPLVENAIKHGVAPKVGVSRILVQAKRRGGLILLSVEDDGMGLDTRRDRDKALGTGVGLQNIRERLQTMYGSTASLSVTNIESGGSRAMLEIPAGEQRDADSCVPGR